MGRFYPTPEGHIRFDDTDGRRVWSSDGRPVNLLPEDYWQTLLVTVSFPDFIKGNAYGFSKVEIDAPFPSGGTFADVAVITTILPQEWGPAIGGARNLPDQVLGTVPGECDYIDVRATLSRTQAPSGYIDMTQAGIGGADVPNMVPTQQSLLRGGSCLCESTAIWRRLFAVRLSAGEIILRRKQSVWGGSNGVTWAPGNSPTYQGGWTYGGPSGAQDAHFAYFERSRRSAWTLPEPWRGGANGLSLTDTSDYSATWTGSLLIRPGFLAS